MKDTKEKKLIDYQDEMREFVKNKAKMELYLDNFDQYIEEEITEDTVIMVGAQNLVKLDISQIKDILEQLEVHSHSGTNHSLCPLHFKIKGVTTEVTKVEVIDEEMIIQGNWKIKIIQKFGEDQ